MKSEDPVMMEEEKDPATETSSFQNMQQAA